MIYQGLVRRIYERNIYVPIMNLSMLSPREGALTVRSVPRVGILIVRHIPRVGNLTWPPSWIMKKACKSTLFPRPLPPQVMWERPWERGCLKATPPSWKIPGRRSNELPTFVRGGSTRGEWHIHCTLTVYSKVY